MKKQALQKERKVFLNSMNSWFSNFVIEDLRTDYLPDAKIKYEFMGTKNNSGRPLPKLFEPKEIVIDYNYNYQHEVFKNDIFIYNLEDSDYNEIEYIIKGLKALRYESEKTVIIITSIMTWARTIPKIKKEPTNVQAEEGIDQKDPEESEEEEYVEEEEEKTEEELKKEAELIEGNEKKEQEPQKKILSFKDNDFLLRVPAKKYYPYKMIETLALANTNPMLKTYIICPGFIYGCGEDFFYEYFKMAWLQNPPKLPIIGKGKNTIPTIHIKDLVTLIRRIIDRKPIAKYIFAVDKTKNRSLKKIIKSISKCTGNGEVELLTEFNVDQVNIPNYNEITIDVKVKPSKLFFDEKDPHEDQEDFEQRCFKWHCEFGIPENLDKLREEFNEYRGLKPIKIMITGPPASGKSFVTDRLREHYDIPSFNISQIIEWGRNLQDPLGQEIRDKTEEINEQVKQALEAYEKRKNKKKTDPPLDVSQMKKLPEDLVVKIVRRQLLDNLCLNRGYILDGYPREYRDAVLLFLKDTDSSKAIDDPTRFQLMKEITPHSVIRLENLPDDFLKNRIKSQPDYQLRGPNVVDERMTRRLAKYKILNESPKGDPSLSNFYLQNNISVYGIDGKLQEHDLMDKCKVFIERNGKVENFQKLDDEEQVIQKNVVDEEIKNEFEQAEFEIKEDESFEYHKKESKVNHNKKKLDDLKERERQLLEKKSEVLRNYLHDNVMPLLSKGILHVCQTLPDDPVDALANYLLDNAFAAKFQQNKSKEP